MTPLDLHARVFISCGQADGTNEIATAQGVAERLRRLGYDPYVAKDEQSLRSLRENIFPLLRDTEYFLFIDFRREQIGLDSGGGPEYRGSLFSHQELAIASFLDIALLGFRETGVKKLDGLVSALQANCIAFTERGFLPELVESEVRRRGWRNDWQNRLELRLPSPPCTRAIRLPENVYGRFFHIAVHNHHRYVMARDCFAYLRSVVDKATGHDLPLQTVELKWAGYTFPSASIGPGAFRKLDAFWIAEPDPTRPRFNSFADSTEYVPGITGPGAWELEYEVVSSSVSVPGARLSLTLEVGSRVDDIRLGGVPCLPVNGLATTNTPTSSSVVLLMSDVIAGRAAHNP